MVHVLNYIHRLVLGEFQGRIRDTVECTYHNSRFRIGLEGYNSFEGFHLNGES